MTQNRRNRDPMREYLDWQRRERRRRIVWAIVAWTITLLSAAAVLVVLGGIVAYAIAALG